jgi:hypothetical protein
LDIHSLLGAAMATLTGFHCIMFATFTKVFMIRENLLPPDKRLRQFLQNAYLESFTVLGLLLFLGGVGGFLHAAIVWGKASFGPLNPIEIMRLVIPSVTAIALGIEMVLARIFLSVLALPTRMRSEEDTAKESVIET